MILRQTIQEANLMEIRTLRYFLAVAHEENMTKAAEILHVIQPTLSKALKALEGPWILAEGVVPDRGTGCVKIPGAFIGTRVKCLDSEIPTLAYGDSIDVHHDHRG